MAKKKTSKGKGRAKRARAKSPGTLRDALLVVRKEKEKKVDDVRYHLLTATEGMLRKLGA